MLITLTWRRGLRRHAPVGVPDGGYRLDFYPELATLSERSALHARVLPAVPVVSIVIP
jgi:hypothetical protein